MSEGSTHETSSRVQEGSRNALEEWFLITTSSIHFIQKEWGDRLLACCFRLVVALEMRIQNFASNRFPRYHQDAVLGLHTLGHHHTTRPSGTLQTPAPKRVFTVALGSCAQVYSQTQQVWLTG